MSYLSGSVERLLNGHGEPVRGVRFRSGTVARSAVTLERRVCAHDGCGTVLNRYNCADRCMTHRTPRTFRNRGVKEDPDW